MKTLHHLSKLFCILSLVLHSSCNADKTKTEASQDEYEKPNIVLIMGDDMGWSDIGCYGSEISTPRLDALAKNGLQFTQFYNVARCCPTRASLLTGLYPQQAGIGHMVDDRGTPAFKGDLSFNAMTIAEVLKLNGYSTYLAGKWHVTPYVIDNPDKHNWPLQRGFDKFYGMVSGAGSLYDPRSLTNQNEYVTPEEDFYATSTYTDYAIKYINEHATENPFFLFVSHQAAHWPMHAPAEAIAKHKGKYDEGWDVIREKRYQKLKSLGLVKPEWELTPRDSFVDAWSDDIPDRDWELANMEVYAAMIDVMDAEIGRLVDHLDAKGMLDNTLILYLQDNGACAEELQWVASRPDPSSLKPMAPGELQTAMVPTITRDGKPIKLMKNAEPGPPESYTAYGLNWANASNTPFREYKHWVHEGGISSPLIAHWPAGIKNSGSRNDTPSHLIDIMATFVDISDAEYPTEYNQHTITPLEGKSLNTIFKGEGLQRDAIYWEHEGNRAVRQGKWKLISKASKNNSFIWDKTDSLANDNWELFNMEKDRTEMNDIASNNSDLVKQMSDKWMVWAKRTGIVPRPEK